MPRIHALITISMVFLAHCFLVACSDENANHPGTPDHNTSTPIVKAGHSYSVTRSTHVYAQGLSHDEWGGEASTPMDILLDLYEPVGAPDNRPALVVIHEGGFKQGSRRGPFESRFADYFSARGWVVASVDYRLTGDRGTIPLDFGDSVNENVAPALKEMTLAIYPASRDIKAAIRWLYAHAGTYRINTHHIAVMGGSAGAHLSIMAGVSEASDYRDELTVEEDETLASTHLDQPSKVAAILDYAGGLEPLTILEEVFGRQTFDETDAPVQIVHGTADATVSFRNAEALRDAYLATGVDFAFHPLEGWGHNIFDGTVFVDGQGLEELGFDFLVSRQGLIVE